VIGDLRTATSRRACRERYGVVVRDGLEVDSAATAALRRELAARRLWLTVTATDDTLYLRGAVSRRRICRLNPADAQRAGLADGAIVELVAARAAPLRAWLVHDRRADGPRAARSARRRVLGVAAASRSTFARSEGV